MLGFCFTLKFYNAFAKLLFVDYLFQQNVGAEQIE